MDGGSLLADGLIQLGVSGELVAASAETSSAAAGTTPVVEQLQRRSGRSNPSSSPGGPGPGRCR